MSFAGLMMIVKPVSRWWRREHSIKLTLWPAWLAQRLCPHETKTLWSPDTNEIWRCEDCFKVNFPQTSVVKIDLNDGGTGDPK